jgi:hypothetical protein
VDTADIGSTLAIVQTERNYLGIASATSVNTDVVQAFDPNALFRYSEPGVWFDPNDITTLYKGSPSATLVTAPGDAVGYMLDKSQGLVPGPQLVTNGNNETALFNFGVLVNQDTLARASAPGGGFAASFTSNTSSSVSHRSYDGSTSLQANKAYRFTGRVYVPTGGVSTFKLYDNGDGSWFGLDVTVKDQWVSFDIFRSAKASNWSLGIGNNALDVVTSGQVSFWLDDLSIREIPGNHATQATPASRPTYGIVPAGGRRNLFDQTENFSDSSWQKANVTVSPDVAAAPNGTITADKLVGTAFTGQCQLFRNVTFVDNQDYSFSVFIKASEATWVVISIQNQANVYFRQWVNLATGQAGTGTGAVVPAGNGWYRVSLAANSSSGVQTERVYIQPTDADNTTTFTGNGTSGILIWGAQLELGSVATDYQRVTTEYDVTEADVPSLGYLQFNGISNGMITGTITPGTDKVQSFAGVRKNTDSLGVVAELGPIVNTTFGTFFLGTYTGQAFGSSGTTYRDALFTPVANPNTSVLTGLGDISGDRATLRANGVQIAQNTGDQGTGNYNSYVLNIGRRDNSAVAALNGQLFPLIVRFGSNLTAARITSTENWVSSQTPLEWAVGSGFWNDAYPWSDISAWRD